MSYGSMSDAQCEAFKPFVIGKTIHDLGSGDGVLALLMAQIGAKKVIAVDKQDFPRAAKFAAQIEFRSTLFEDFNESVETIFLSWPDNHPLEGLLPLVTQAKTVIYLGKNTDGSVCGWPELFKEFSGREILKHLPERKNTLTIYGPTRLNRPMTGEEFAAINMFTGGPLSFEDTGKIDVSLRGTVL